MNKKKLFGKMFHKKQAYQVIIYNRIQNILDMETEDERAFVEKYPDGKLLSFDTFFGNERFLQSNEKRFTGESAFT